MSFSNINHSPDGVSSDKLHQLHAHGAAHDAAPASVIPADIRPLPLENPENSQSLIMREISAISSADPDAMVVLNALLDIKPEDLTDEQLAVIEQFEKSIQEDQIRLQQEVKEVVVNIDQEDQRIAQVEQAIHQEEQRIDQVEQQVAPFITDLSVQENKAGDCVSEVRELEKNLEGFINIKDVRTFIPDGTILRQIDCSFDSPDDFMRKAKDFILSGQGIVFDFESFRIQIGENLPAEYISLDGDLVDMGNRQVIVFSSEEFLQFYDVISKLIQRSVEKSIKREEKRDLDSAVEHQPSNRPDENITAKPRDNTVVSLKSLLDVDAKITLDLIQRKAESKIDQLNKSIERKRQERIENEKDVKDGDIQKSIRNREYLRLLKLKEALSKMDRSYYNNVLKGIFGSTFNVMGPVNKIKELPIFRTEISVR